ncbi:MAG: metallophosphoesterase [Elusimicrobiota bacterium]|nr:metallophosphoesterase [Elusimicrobiota bacterium]
MFLIVALSIFFAGHFYIAWRINMGLNIAKPYSYCLYAVVIFIAVLMISVQSTVRRGLPEILSPLAPISYVLMGWFAITITVFILNDIINIPNLFLKIKSFRYYTTLFALILSLVLSIAAIINFAAVLKINEVHIKVPNLSVNSLRIVHLSDLHINAYTKPKVINKIFDKVESLKPDMIVITGDVIDTDINKDDKFLDYGFTKLKAPYGVFAVSGNHEYYTGIKAFNEMFQKLGVKVLNDESVVAGNVLNVAGINDKNWDNADIINESLSKVNPKYPTIFLSHRPEPFDLAAKNNLDIIQLSGHTHAGQIPPIWIVRKFLMKYNYGIYNIGKSILYITSGTRLWGPPMRLFSSSEIAVIVLEKE